MFACRLPLPLASTSQLSRLVVTGFSGFICALAVSAVAAVRLMSRSSVMAASLILLPPSR